MRGQFAGRRRARPHLALPAPYRLRARSGTLAAMTLLQLRNQDARIAYLATVYHLGRPGSETDPQTLQKHDLGLQSVHDEIVPQLEQAVVEVEVSAYQLLRLGQALQGVSNELKQYGMARGHSAVPRFQETVESLFPETKQDPGLAIDVVQHAVMLHRRLSGALQQAQREAARAAGEQRPATDGAGRPWWKFWRRSP
jgi:hypothetical protein